VRRTTEPAFQMIAGFERNRPHSFKASRIPQAAFQSPWPKARRRSSAGSCVDRCELLLQGLPGPFGRLRSLGESALDALLRSEGAGTGSSSIGVPVIFFIEPPAPPGMTQLRRGALSRYAASRRRCPDRVVTTSVWSPRPPVASSLPVKLSRKASASSGSVGDRRGPGWALHAQGLVNAGIEPATSPPG
jgi:hypothetical protein